MEKIVQVEWKVKPATGYTNIELSELHCKTIKEWTSLDRKEQERRLNAALIYSDQNTLKILATEWDN